MASKIPNAMNLRQFMLRQEVLKLYRQMMRCVRLVDDPAHRKELWIWVRRDFEMNKHHQDEDVIRMHLARGKKHYKELESSITLAR
ncbi:LYR motif-containing protein 2-like [Lineus longissimus]|uniref:LYR motif-containing protein 2-like n=1 Tax=Lineus longissimus TaxID=88925 RepID=UPI002B4F299D